MTTWQPSEGKGQGIFALPLKQRGRETGVGEAGSLPPEGCGAHTSCCHTPWPVAQSQIPVFGLCLLPEELPFIAGFH